MFLTYLYLLRVQVLVGLALVLFPYIALESRAESLLEGLFDLSWPGTAVAAFLTLVLAAAVATCVEIVLRYGSLRCDGVAPPSAWMSHAVVSRKYLDIRRYTLFNVAFAAGCALPMIVALIMTSVSSQTQGGRAIAALAALAAFILFVVVIFLLWSAAPDDVNARLGRLFLWSPSGYLDGRGLRWGHGFAATAVVISLLIYIAFGLGKWASLECEGSSSGMCSAAGMLAPWVPSTLACILVLLALICYAASGVAFFVDRFRVPLLATIAILLMLGQDWPGSDHYYTVREAKDPVSPPPDPASVLTGERAIVVAASGGGIHAAAWAAAVLAQLASDNPDTFVPSLRLISAVSGGSVGTIHVVHAIARNEFPGPPGPGSAFDAAARSSLDDIAWGLTYPDLLRLAIPWVSLPDRGWAAEHAWARGNPALLEPIRNWDAAVAAGKLPAVILNATIEETGGRLMIGTTSMSGRAPGRTTFRELYPDHDISPVTAARLSATFPYVSPAARIDAWVPFKDRYHIVDGGYYDNFGVSSLVEWLEIALARSGVKRVLVIQIRGPIASEDRPADGARGFFHQATAPLLTLTHFRNAAQIAHNTTELRLLCLAAASKVEIRNEDFQYPQADIPLSWHLTPTQQKEVLELAKCEPNASQTGPLAAACRNIVAAREAVKAFLGPRTESSPPVPVEQAWQARRRTCEADFGPGTPVMPPPTAVASAASPAEAR